MPTASRRRSTISTPEPPASLDPDRSADLRPRAVPRLDAPGQVTLHLSGVWRLLDPPGGPGDSGDAADPPDAESLDRQLADLPDLRRLSFDTGGLRDWDSRLAAFLAALIRAVRQRGLEVDLAGLPEGLRALLALAAAVPERRPDRHREHADPFLRRFGQDVIALARSTGEILAFIGEIALALRRLLLGRARLRASELWLTIEEVGADALPIVSLISFLVGMILGYLGDQQLGQFGARIFVADLVGLAIVIQMGALITAIVLAGRTGAAFAAQLGTMQVNEEIDALRTLGISPVEFLVLPRLLALVTMTPLLAIYANVMGILGGAFVGTLVGGLTLIEYAVQTQAAIGWNHLAQGLISATVYGAIVAISGCLRGMQCGRSAAAVGEATTSAVVTAILFIVIAAAVLTVIFDALGFNARLA